MRRVVVLAVAAALIVAGAGPVQAASTRVTATVAASAGAVLEVSGSTSTGSKGRTIRVQVRSGATWMNLASTSLTSSRRFSVSVVPVLGKRTYRVVALEKGSARRGVSASVRFTGRLRLGTGPTVAGETSSVSGRTPSRRARPVSLQRRSSATWRTVGRTTSRSDGRFSVSTTAASGSWRVVTPAVHVGSRRLATWTSDATSLTTTDQAVTLEPAQALVVGESASLRSASVPARPGRTVRLERLRHDDWVTVSTARQDLKGRASFGVTHDRSGPVTYRAVVEAWRGAPSSTSVAVTSKVTESDTLDEEVPDFPKGTGPVTRIDENASPASLLDPYGAERRRSFSSNGRWFVFTSRSPHLTPKDENGTADAFLYDRATGSTRPLATHPDGSTPRYGSDRVSISANGRWIAFRTSSEFLHGTGRGTTVVVVLDRQSGMLRQIGTNGSHSPSISADGSHVTYAAPSDVGDSEHVQNLYLWSRSTDDSVLITQTTDGSATVPATLDGVSMSRDARFLLYEASSDKAAPGGAEGSAILWDRDRGTREIVETGRYFSPDDAQISDDGRFVVYVTTRPTGPSDLGTADGDLSDDVVIWDRVSGTRALASEGSVRADEAIMTISPDARYVVYSSAREGKRSGSRIARWDRVTGTRVELDLRGTSEGFADTLEPRTITPDGSRLLAAATDDPLPADGDDHRARDLFAIAFSGTDVGGHTGFAPRRRGNAVEWTFLKDLPSATGLSLVSRASNGDAADGDSGSSSVSGDGRFVVFMSEAEDLDPSARNDPSGPGPSPSDVFVWDRSTGRIDRITDGLDGGGGDRSSGSPQISEDGRWVAFASSASNLVPGDVDIDVDYDVFLWDRVTDSTRMVTTLPPGASDRAQGRRPVQFDMSSDGNHLALATDADLEDGVGLSTFGSRLYTWDRRNGELASFQLKRQGPGGLDPNDSPGSVAISGDGRSVAFTQSLDDMVSSSDRRIEDVWLWHVPSGNYDIVSRTPTGALANASSADPSLSADGSVLAFSSKASDLVQDDRNDSWDVFIRDQRTGSTTALSRADGVTPEGNSRRPRVSDDGSVVVFQSTAYRLDRRDDNRSQDVFIWRRSDGLVRLVSRAVTGGAGWRTSGGPAISGNGRYVVFASEADDLGPRDENDRFDVYFWPVP